MTLRLNLRITCEQVQEYAGRFSYRHPFDIERLALRVRETGTLIRDELYNAAHHKSHRRASLVLENSEEEVQTTARAAFAATSARQTMAILTSLKGVGMPVASLIKYLADPRTPILDRRVLWTYGIPQPRVYSLLFWERYEAAIVALSEEWGIPVRTLDKAAWQFSKEHQGVLLPLGSCCTCTG